MSDRARSQSPRRQASKGSGGGFRWKERRRTDEDVYKRNDRRDEGRGYGDVYTHREGDWRDRERGERPRGRGESRDRWSDGRRLSRDGGGRGERENEGGFDGESSRKAKSKSKSKSKSSSHSNSSSNSRDKTGEEGGAGSSCKARRDQKDKGAKKPEFIVVHVNDRMGTKAAIPCLPTDLIRQFKVMVAAHIGRQPYEITLKRQGERPFKDHICLADYGISNGVQLDLEVNAGD